MQARHWVNLLVYAGQEAAFRLAVLWCWNVTLLARATYSLNVAESLAWCC